jgi:methyl-accepting chemotaxis protein
MRRTSLATRLYLAFGLLVALIIMLAATAVVRVRRLESTLSDIAEVHTVALELAAVGLVQGQVASRLAQDALLEENADRARALLQTLDQVRGASDRIGIELEALLAHESAGGAYRAVSEARRAYREAFAPVRLHIERGERDAAVAETVARLAVRRRALDEAWAQFIDTERKATQRAAELGQQDLARAVREIVLSSAAALGLALAVGAWTLPRVLGTLEATSRAIHALAQGDLREGMPVTRRDELGELQGAIARLTERLGGSLMLLAANAELLDEGAARLSRTSREMGEATRAHAEVVTAAALLLPRIAIRLDGSLARAAADADAWDAVAELNRLITRIDETARHNRAGADGAADEAARLAAQARALHEALEEVRLPGRAPPGPALVTPRRPPTP